MSLAVLADHMASKGRGPDSMLIHMSPREVQGLQALAMKNGGSLTINPDTGLPEAGFLDKLLPTIIGAGLTFFSGGAINPMMAAGIVGGIQTARTGDIGKGISAGLGAYGGAGLTAGLSEAGASSLGAGEAAKGLTMTPDLANELMNAGAGESAAAANNALQQQVTEKMAAATPYEKLSAGMDVAKTNPMGMAKSLSTPLMMAAGPAIMAGANVQARGPQTVTKPGMIRPYSYDPYGGTYTAGTPYEAAPTKAADGGLMGMNNGGYNPGQLDFTQKSEPVVRMAEGGIASFAIGGDVKQQIDAAYAAGDFAKVNELAQSNKITAADVGETWKGFDTSGLAGLGVNLYTPPAAQANTPMGNTVAAPTYNQYTNEQIGKYLTDNPTADIAAATKTTNADPAAVNAYIASLANPFVGSTETTGGSGTLGIYNQMKAQGIDPNELYNAANAAATANKSTYGGWSAADIAKGYNLDKGAYELTAQIEKDKIAADPVLGYDKQWVKYMEDNKYSVDDMAQAFGISKNEIRDRIQKVKAAETKVITKDTVTGATGNDVILPDPFTSVTPTGYYGNDTGNPLTQTPGDITTNPDGTVTVQPNIPGRPTGGFPGIGAVKDAYTAGGGSLGYIPYAPKTIDEFNNKYNKLTGGSKQAYDYLTGKTPYDPVPFTKTGEIQKPYWESVGRFPVNLKTKKYLFKNGKYELNPDFVEPSYVLAAKKAAADKETTKADAALGKSINVLDAQGNNEPAYLRDDGFYYTSGGNKFDEKGAQVAAGGGLAALTMAGGGMSGQYDLGSYSDGGRLLRGPGDGVSDSIPATIGNKRPARLADGEFVVPARIVSELGNGSTEAGARKLYAMMDRVQAARKGSIGKGKVAKNSRADKYLPA